MGLFKKKSPEQKAQEQAARQRLQNAHDGAGSWGPLHQDLRGAVGDFESGRIDASWQYDTLPAMATQYAELWLAAGPNPTPAEVDYFWDHTLNSFWENKMWPYEWSSESVGLARSIADAIMGEVLTQTGMTRD